MSVWKIQVTEGMHRRAHFSLYSLNHDRSGGTLGVLFSVGITRYLLKNQNLTQGEDKDGILSKAVSTNNASSIQARNSAGQIHMCVHTELECSDTMSVCKHCRYSHDPVYIMKKVRPTIYIDYP